MIDYLMNHHCAQPLLLYKMLRFVSLDMCDGNFKRENIRVHGNATIIKQTGPKLVYSVEQRKALKLMKIVEKMCPIAQRDGL